MTQDWAVAENAPHAGGDPEEQKEWLQEYLNKEFEKEGWGDGRIAWQDVAKRKSDLSNNEIFQVSQSFSSSIQLF